MALKWLRVKIWPRAKGRQQHASHSIGWQTPCAKQSQIPSLQCPRGMRW
jgi:hypothetical protein